MDLPAWHPDSPWTPGERESGTRQVRDAVPRCLPGEPDDRGGPVWSHYAPCPGMLKARTQAFIDITPGAGFAEDARARELNSCRREPGDDDQQDGR